MITRSGRSCGALFFQVQGPRQVKAYAVWAGEEDRILFYDSAGVRFAQVNTPERGTRTHSGWQREAPNTDYLPARLNQSRDGNRMIRTNSNPRPVWRAASAMCPLRLVAADRAGPTAVGILVPPSRRPCLIVRPRSISFDLLVLAEARGITFREFDREQAGRAAEALFDTLVEWSSRRIECRIGSEMADSSENERVPAISRRAVSP